MHRAAACVLGVTHAPRAQQQQAEQGEEEERGHAAADTPAAALVQCCEARAVCLLSHTRRRRVALRAASAVKHGPRSASEVARGIGAWRARLLSMTSTGDVLQVSQLRAHLCMSAVASSRSKASLESVLRWRMCRGAEEANVRQAALRTFSPHARTDGGELVLPSCQHHALLILVRRHAEATRRACALSQLTS